MASASRPAPPPSEIVERRVETALRVAASRRTGVPVHELSELLPHDGPEGGPAVAAWMAEHPPFGTVRDEFAVAPGGELPLPELTERRARGTVYLESARRFVGSEAFLARPLLECAGVTGSAAYGEPEAGEDCDLLAVTRPGAVWPFLTYVYLRLRVSPPASGPTGPTDWCFNYVLDSGAARKEFSRPRGFLFAREALTTRPIHGERHYRSLLASAPWLGKEAPRMYARWEAQGLVESDPLPPAPWPVRLLNLVLFPLVAAYLQGQGLRRNHQLRRQGRELECFQTVTNRDRLVILSEKFARIAEVYAPSTALTPEG
ncbi:MAG: hypothetical protein L3K19_02125 [Thermoplasmata archaeon]|nr:hypothetical protein [Thermoplasmata archaeon]